MSELEEEKKKSKISKEEEIKRAELKLQKAKERLAQVKKDASKRERRERDTAIFTIGAAFLAAAERGDEALRSQILSLYSSIPREFGLELTDYRRQCVETTPFKGMR